MHKSFDELTFNWRDFPQDKLRAVVNHVEQLPNLSKKQHTTLSKMRYRLMWHWAYEPIKEVQ